jgi:hypothetical protein
LAYAKTGSCPTENDFSSFENQYYEVPMDKFKQFACPAKRK